jgi:hypothetical protein
MLQFKSLHQYQKHKINKMSFFVLLDIIDRENTMDVFGPPPLATAGVCIWGAGDCGPKVNNVSQSFNVQLVENIKETLINKSTSIGATMSTNQVFSLTNVDMSLCQNSNISGISQKAVANYNFSMVEKAFDETSFTNMMRTAVNKTLDQNITAKSEALNGGNTGVVNNVNQSYSNSVDRLVNSINFNDFKNVMSEMQIRQTIGLSGLKLSGKNCNISDISQFAMMEIAASMLSEKVTVEFTKLAKENEQKESTKSTSTFFASGVLGDLGRGISGVVSGVTTGLSNLIGELSKPLMMIGIILVVIILAYIINTAFFSGKAERKLDENPSTQAEVAPAQPEQVPEQFALEQSEQSQEQFAPLQAGVVPGEAGFGEVGTPVQQFEPAPQPKTGQWEKRNGGLVVGSCGCDGGDSGDIQYQGEGALGEFISRASSSALKGIGKIGDTLTKGVAFIGETAMDGTGTVKRGITSALNKVETAL